MKRLITILTLILLCGCTKTVYVDSNGNEIDNPNVYDTKFDNQFIVVKGSLNNYYELRHIETGIHYIWVRSGYGGGLSPLYEADGTIRVTK